jgi:hypothetical protein
MKNRRNYYRILQVQPDAPSEIIQASYRTMMRELRQHPDLGGSTAEAALLNEAYEVLSDRKRRTAYDDELFRRYTKLAGNKTKTPVVPVFCPVCRRPLTRDPAPGESCLTCQTPLQSPRDSDSGQMDNRAIDRTGSSESIVYFSSWPGTAKRGRMVDFSPKGMRFICVEKLVPRTVLKISSRRFEASGTVTNVSETVAEGKKCYAVGVSFIAVQFSESRGTFFSTSA